MIESPNNMTFAKNFIKDGHLFNLVNVITYYVVKPRRGKKKKKKKKGKKRPR